MNEAEYNRKMKGIERDIDRIRSQIETLIGKKQEAYSRRHNLVMDGWGE